MSIPNRCFKTKMFICRKVTSSHTNERNAQPNCTNHNMKTVKSCSHIEYGTVNTIVHMKICSTILNVLSKQKQES